VAHDPARNDLLARMDTAWRAFRDAVESARDGGLERTTPSGWTVRAMLAHVAAWHDATAYRLYRFGATDRAQPKLEPDDDVFNARIAAESEALEDDRVIADLDRSHDRFRTAVLELPTGFADTDDGWVEAVVGGNSYEHYPEHLEELDAMGSATD
jgi:Mycothiol maleylpyruvate isomerase N-terminal domain